MKYTIVSIFIPVATRNGPFYEVCRMRGRIFSEDSQEKVFTLIALRDKLRAFVESGQEWPGDIEMSSGEQN